MFNKIFNKIHSFVLPAKVLMIAAAVIVGGFGVTVAVESGMGVSLVPTVKAQRFDKLVIPKPSTLPGPTDDSQNSTYLRDVLIISVTRTLISLVGGLALLFFIIGGVRMLTAYGDEAALTASKKMLYWSVIGFMISIFSFAIVTIIGNIRLGTDNERIPQSTNSSTSSGQSGTSSSSGAPPITNQK